MQVTPGRTGTLLGATQRTSEAPRPEGVASGRPPKGAKRQNSKNGPFAVPFSPEFDNGNNSNGYAGTAEPSSVARPEAVVS